MPGIDYPSFRCLCQAASDGNHYPLRFFALSQARVSSVTFIANCARLYPMVREIDVVRMLDGRSALGSHNDWNPGPGPGAEGLDTAGAAGSLDVRTADSRRDAGADLCDGGAARHLTSAFFPPPLSQVGLNMKVLAYAVGLRAERFERHSAGFVGDCRRCCLGSATLALWHSLLQRVQTDVARDG